MSCLRLAQRRFLIPVGNVKPEFLRPFCSKSGFLIRSLSDDTSRPSASWPCWPAWAWWADPALGIVLVPTLLLAIGRLAWVRHSWHAGTIRPVLAEPSARELIRVLAYLGDLLPWCETSAGPIEPSRLGRRCS
jgi:hypothetical protein